MKKKLMYLAILQIFALSFISSCTSGKRIYSCYESNPVGLVRANGWLQNMVVTETCGATGHLDELAPQISSHIFFTHNINIEGQFGWWNGEMEGDWIDGFTRLAASTDDTFLLKKSERWFAKLMEVQKNDKEPYIGIYSNDSEKYPRWVNICGELWPQCRVFLAMEGYYERTGDSAILNSLIRAADLTIFHLHRDLPEYKDNVNSHALMMVEPMLKLFNLTGDKRYLDFSVFLYKKLHWFNDLTLSGELFLHGVHVVQNIRIPTLLYEYTGDPEYLIEGLKGIDICTERYMNVAGTIRSDEMVGYAVPDRGSEYCTTVEWFITNVETARITGKMQYADVAERCYFNAAQGARLSDGSGLQYSSFPNQIYVTEQGTDEWRTQPLYGPTHHPLCCNPMAGRLLPAYMNNMWQRVPSGGFLAMLYGPSTFSTELNNNKITIKEVTEYPYEESIKFVIDAEKPASFPLKFRIPVWCNNFSVKLNGNNIQYKRENYIATIIETWNKGDIIELNLPMKVKTEFLREWVSVSRGPVVYALPVPYERVLAKQVAPGFAFYRYLPDKDFAWNQVLMFKKVPADSAFLTLQVAANPAEFPWTGKIVNIRTKAQAANDKWRLGMQWYTKENLQPPPPPSAVLAYQIDQKLSEYITLVPYGTTKLRIVYFPYAVEVKE
jgi:DUF1680 family protein